jgi:hypothetical protein
MTNGKDFVGVITDETTIAQAGLTKREYFAAMALQGMLSYDRTRHLDDISRWSAEAADALIKTLNETQTTTQ